MNLPQLFKSESWTLSFALLICFEIYCALGCPKVCECKWKYGKIWVICSDAKFIDVPQGLEPSTQVLDLSNNNLKILFRDAFIDRGLVNLQKVFLVNCNLRKLDNHCFRRLANLVELNLSYNSLSSVPTNALADVPGLRELRMKRNSLKMVLSGAFQVVPDLVHLDLSFNVIESVHADAFQNLVHLEVLKLSGNKMITITEKHFKPLLSLHEVDLHGNLWNCDCNLRSAIKWFGTRNLAVSSIPKCVKPSHLSQVSWGEINPDTLFCIPRVIPLSPRILVTNGDNVTLACKAMTIDSDAKITWHAENKLLMNESLVDTDGGRYNIYVAVTKNKRLQTTFSNLTISEADFQDEGTYRCIVENEGGLVETNLTLQVSEVIREDPLVAPTDSYIAGAVVGGVAVLGLLLICLSVLIYRKGCQSKRKAEVDKVSVKDKGNFVSPATSESLNFGSEATKTSCYGDVLSNDRVNSRLSETQNSGFYKNNEIELNLQPSSKCGGPSISYLKVKERGPLLQSDNAEFDFGVSTQYPDILLRTGRTHPFCTISRRFNKGMGKEYLERESKLQKELISRSSTCINERKTSETQSCSYHSEDVPYTYSFEALNVFGEPKIEQRGSTPRLDDPGDPYTIEGLSPGDLQVGGQAQTHQISAEQLSRILREYSYMKQELRRLKGIEKRDKRLRKCSHLPPPFRSGATEVQPPSMAPTLTYIQAPSGSNLNPTSITPSGVMEAEGFPHPIIPPPECYHNDFGGPSMALGEECGPRGPPAQQSRTIDPLCPAQPHQKETHSYVHLADVGPYPGPK